MGRRPRLGVAAPEAGSLCRFAIENAGFRQTEGWCSKLSARRIQATESANRGAAAVSRKSIVVRLPAALAGASHANRSEAMAADERGNCTAAFKEFLKLAGRGGAESATMACTLKRSG